jgi:hypothetical protein
MRLMITPESSAMRAGTAMNQRRGRRLELGLERSAAAPSLIGASAADRFMYCFAREQAHTVLERRGSQLSEYSGAFCNPDGAR